LHDHYGYSLKAYRRDVIKGARLYDGMHRFIPIYTTGLDARVTEFPVQHHPRTAGVFKWESSEVQFSIQVFAQ
jgi:hypothetical protein